MTAAFLDRFRAMIGRWTEPETPAATPAEPDASTVIQGAIEHYQRLRQAATQIQPHTGDAHAEAVDRVCMAGRTTIRIHPKQSRCPVCGPLFKGKPPRCPSCGRIPEGRYQLCWWYKGERFRPETRREDGEPLDSWARAVEEASEIATLIKKKRFDPALFRTRAKSVYLLETRYKSWIAGIERLERAGKRAPGYVRLSKTHWRAHLSKWATLDLREANKATLTDIRDELLQTLSAAYVANLMGTIHAILVHAKDLGVIPYVPSMPDPETDESPFIRLELEAQLAGLAEVPAEHRPLFLSFAEVGQRSGELRALRVMDFDKDRPSFRIRQHYSAREIQRGRKGRTAEHEVPISRGLADLLCQMLDDRAEKMGAEPHPESRLFLTPRGVPYDERYTKIWRKASEDAGIPYVHPYNAFKHTLGYQMRLTGASRTDIQAWFGHRSGKSTDRYFRDDVHVLERIRGLALQARTPTMPIMKEDQS